MILGDRIKRRSYQTLYDRVTTSGILSKALGNTPSAARVDRASRSRRMADEEHEHLEKVSSLSLKDLRALVKEAGLSSDDCITYPILRLRAAEAVERLLLPGAKLGPIGKSLGLVATAAAPASGAAGLAELLGDTLLTKEGEVPVSTALSGKKYIMLYFSAHWCPPCKQYTPELARAYTASTKQAEVAIVFVSSDRDQKSFDSYYAEMPFYALPFGARDEAASLGEKFGIRGIPTLVLLDGEGKLVNASITGGHGQYL